jgi:hypothetical protein
MTFSTKDASVSLTRQTDDVISGVPRFDNKAAGIPDKPQYKNTTPLRVVLGAAMCMTRI